MAVADQFLVTMTISAKIIINHFLKSELRNGYFLQKYSFRSRLQNNCPEDAHKVT